MTITVMFPGDTEPVDDTFTLDESAGEQDDTSNLPTDADDDDIARAGLPPSFDTLLFTTMGLDPAFPEGGRLAESSENFINVTSTGTLEQFPPR